MKDNDAIKLDKNGKPLISYASKFFTTINSPVKLLSHPILLGRIAATAALSRTVIEEWPSQHETVNRLMAKTICNSKEGYEIQGVYESLYRNELYQPVLDIVANNLKEKDRILLANNITVPVGGFFP